MDIIETWYGDEEPCLIRVTSFTPGCAGRIYGPPEFCYPPEPPEIEWEVIDENGAPVDVELSSSDAERIEELIIRQYEEEAREYHGGRWDD